MDTSGWDLAWVLPNINIHAPIIHRHIAAVPHTDRDTGVKLFPDGDKAAIMGSFKNEFGRPISPSALMLALEAPESIKTAPAINGFRDVICATAITLCNSRAIVWDRHSGIMFSDAFDIYPWSLSRLQGRVVASTPGLNGIHQLSKLQATSAPAIPNRELSASDLDDDLLRQLLNSWDEYVEIGRETTEHRKLFRSLDMARSAARMPGSADATIFDFGRAIAHWISALEILAHDGRSDFEKVVDLLKRNEWNLARLKRNDYTIKHRKKSISVNIAGVVYKAMYDARNKFLHGEPVTIETLQLPGGRNLLGFAAPLYRVTLSAFLRSRRSTPIHSDEAHDAPPRSGELLAEKALLLALSPSASCED